MKIYLAGPMRGYHKFNFALFHSVAEELRAVGHEVFSPAEHSIKLMGFDPSERSDDGVDAEAGVSVRVFLEDDLTWICRNAEAVVCLPGAMSSTGATAEVACARSLDDPKCKVLEYFNERDRLTLGLKPLEFCKCP